MEPSHPQPAPKWRRLAGHLIDQAILLSLSILQWIELMAWVLRQVENATPYAESLWGLWGRLALLACMSSVYFALFETVLGRTPGKMLAGTVVKTWDHGSPGFWRVLWRTLLRGLPMEPFSVLFGRTSRGWHDQLSGTVVTIAEDEVQPTAKQLPDALRWKRVVSGLVDAPLAVLFALPAALVAVPFLQVFVSDVALTILYAALVLVLTAAWFAVFELVAGRTPGKLLTGTAVRREDGSFPSRSQIVRRSLVRLIPLNPVSAWFPGRKRPGEEQRKPGRWWHDTWSGTRVVVTQERKWLEDRWLEFSVWWRPAPWLRGALFYEVLLYPGIWLPLGGLILVTIYWCGRGFGAPLLFWHDRPLFAFVAGVTTALTVAWGILLFFSLNYSKWLEERQKVETWAQRQGLDVDGLEQASVPAGRDGHAKTGPESDDWVDPLPSGEHWTKPLFGHFQQVWGKAPRDDDPQAVDYALRLRSFFFRSVTNGVFVLLAVLFVTRVGLVEWDRISQWLERAQESQDAKAAGLELLQHRINEIGKGESVSLLDWRWWMFPLGCIVGILAVEALDRVKIGVLKAIGSHRLKAPDEAVRERGLMYLMGGYGILILGLVHVILFLLGQYGEQFLAAPALCVMSGWIMLLYALAALLLRNLARFAVGAAVVFALFILAGPGLVQNQRYEYKNLERGKDLTPILVSEDLALADPAASPVEKPGNGEGFYRDIPPDGKPGEVTVMPAQWAPDQPLVIVCASGGGITAEVWAVEMLNLLSKRLEGFAEKVRIVTGASGGMVGAAAWVQLQAEFAGMAAADLPESEKQELRAYLFGGQKDGPQSERALTAYQEQRAALFLAERALRQRCDDDQLSATTLRMALCDMTPLGLAQRFALLRHQDRGNVLEQLWVGNEETGRRGILPGLKTSLGSMARLEREGKAPSLIFAPVIAEDGRQFLVSNLELSRLTGVTSGEGQKPYFKDRIVTAVEAGSILGFDKVRNQPISSWARMSATFPLVTPAGTIQVQPKASGLDEPREQVLHLVDAGYSDNYGTPTAIGWLREYWLPWLKQAGSTAPKNVIIIELDAYPRYGDAWSYPMPDKRMDRMKEIAQDFAQEQVKRVGLEKQAQAILPHKEQEQAGRAKLLPPVEEQTTPLVTLSDLLFEDGASVLTGVLHRNRSAVFRSEQIVEQFSQTLTELKDANPSRYAGLNFQVFRLINPVPASLSWTLSSGERKLLETLSKEIGEFLDKPHPSQPGDPSFQYLLRHRYDSPTAAHAACTFMQLFELALHWAKLQGKEAALGEVEPWLRWTFGQESRTQKANLLPPHNAGWEKESNGLQLELVRCERQLPGGGDAGSQPRTEVFWISSREVTQGQWYDLMGEIHRANRPRSPFHPLEDVTFEEAKRFCERLTEHEQAANRIDSAWVYTLPSHEQWQWACRAGGKGDFSPENRPLDQLAWFQENSDGISQQAGRKEPNAWGLHDMHGNVWEWCVSTTAPAPTAEAPAQPSGVLLGGDALSSPDQCRAGFRPDAAETQLLRGFRPVLQKK